MALSQEMMRFFRHICLWVLVSFLFWSLPIAKANSTETSVIGKESFKKIISYLLVSEKDMDTYKKMFASLDKADFETFDSLQKELENYILLGPALAEKYLHPKYKSNFSELAEWLEEYNSHPQATRIYRLAKRKGRKGAEIKHPVYVDDGASAPDKVSSYVRKQKKQFKSYINRGKTLPARLILENKRFRNAAPNELWDELAATLAQKYLVDNYDRQAYDWAVRAARRHNSGTAAWIAGLSAWRMKNYKNAALYFTRLGKSKNSDEWLVAAGAYWAHRTYDKLGNLEQAQEMLKTASEFKHTFYGILAANKLGLNPNYNWNANAYFNDFKSNDYLYELVSSPYIRRAVLLLHANQPKLAEQELRFGYPQMNAKQREAVIFMAGQHGLHSLAIHLTNQHRDMPQKRNYDNFAYPLPTWLPTQGWKVDKALVLGLIRQESAFRSDAVSSAGARGLMQLMPNTAYHITKDARVKRDKTQLFDADYNLMLGQKYISYLLDKPFINGNLFFMIAAYNAGPGNLVKWQKKARFQNDALLFIEVLPSAQTRIYIERVMANYWIYNMRFGVDNPSLEQIVKDAWPTLQQ